MNAETSGETTGNATVDVSVRVDGAELDGELLKALSLTIMEEMECDNCELSLVICDDTFIHQLNRAYRDKDRPTDVLSFPAHLDAEFGAEFADAGAQPVRVLGDVVISRDTARRQAEAREHSLQYEMAALLIHGVLHLLGYTHENDSDEALMNSKADALLAVLGVKK